MERKSVKGDVVVREIQLVHCGVQNAEFEIRNPKSQASCYPVKRIGDGIYDPEQLILRGEGLELFVGEDGAVFADVDVADVAAAAFADSALHSHL